MDLKVVRSMPASAKYATLENSTTPGKYAVARKFVVFPGDSRPLPWEGGRRVVEGPNINTYYCYYYLRSIQIVTGLNSKLSMIF